MTHDARFGELRSLLQRSASTKTWDALCQHLDLWSYDTLEQTALPYTLDIVTRWPDELERAAPSRWVKALLEGQDAPQVALVNALSLLSRELSQPQLTALLTSPRLANLRRLDLEACWIADAGFAALAASPYLSNLTSLNLSNNDLCHDGAAALAASPLLSHLTDLSIDYIGPEARAVLNASPHLREPIRAQWRKP